MVWPPPSGVHYKIGKTNMYSTITMKYLFSRCQREYWGTTRGPKFINPPSCSYKVPTMNWMLLSGATVVINEDLSLLEVVTFLPLMVWAQMTLELWGLGSSAHSQLHWYVHTKCQNTVMCEGTAVSGSCSRNWSLWLLQRNFKIRLEPEDPHTCSFCKSTCIFLLQLWKCTEHCA